MKLWEKGCASDTQTGEFTAGSDREMDLLLAPFDVAGSLAHIKMLHKINLLSADEHDSLKRELLSIYETIEKGSFEIETDVEDVHSQIEILLTRRLGDTGKKIHTGRSRNDQVALDIKLFIRAKIEETVNKTVDLFRLLTNLSEKHKDFIIPGYTHTQPAMPSSLGLLMGSYAESLTEDMFALRYAFTLANLNPLGSGAGYGSSFPLDREMTTRLLGFDDLNYNVLNAQSGRVKTEHSAAFALSAVASTLVRMSNDICFYISNNIISFPEELTTGSSIMPHKKNPDALEIIRAKCNQLQAIPYECSLVANNLISGYHRDFQVIKETLLPAFEKLNSCMEISIKMLQNIKPEKDIYKLENNELFFSVEEVNKQVLKGAAFRDAYRSVASQIREGKFAPSRQIRHTHQGSIGNLCNDKVAERMNGIVDTFPFEKVNKALKQLLARG